jgi:hypothetical protein
MMLGCRSTLGVDAIVAETYPAIAAAKQVTSTVPIIMAVSSDPIATDLVASLCEPVLLALEIFLPCFFGVRRLRSDHLYFDIEVVFAPIAHEINLASIGQEVRFM